MCLILTFCFLFSLAITCSPNAYYDFCGTACPLTCANHTALIRCPKPCIAGCTCQEGHVLNEGACIPLEQCGCQHNGRDYQLGEEVVLPDTCIKKCTCKQPGHPLECQELTCGPQEICKAVDGIWDCYPVSYGTMWLFGYFYVITFSGAAFSYQGACTYVLTQYCGPPGKLPAFTIHVVNGHRYFIAASLTRQLTLDVYGERIAVKQGQEGKVQVRGAFCKV